MDATTKGKPYPGEIDYDTIVKRDINQIDACDGPVAIIGKESSPGTFFEIFYNSYVLKKPTFLIIEDSKFFKHPWLRYLATERFASVNEFRNWFVAEQQKSM